MNIGILGEKSLASLTVRPFVAADFEEYRRWYEDAELNEQLGPMDDDWLDYVLSDSEGAQCVCLDGERMVAVVGLAIDPEQEAWVITDIAVNPAMRRRGLGRRAVEAVMAQPQFSSLSTWLAYVMPDNPAADRFFTSLGWAQACDPSDDEMARFRLETAAAHSKG